MHLGRIMQSTKFNISRSGNQHFPNFRDNNWRRYVHPLEGPARDAPAGGAGMGPPGGAGRLSPETRIKMTMKYKHKGAQRRQPAGRAPAALQLCAAAETGSAPARIQPGTPAPSLRESAALPGVRRSRLFPRAPAPSGPAAPSADPAGKEAAPLRARPASRPAPRRRAAEG